MANADQQTPSTRVVVVDDHDLVRSGLIESLNTQAGLVVVGGAGTIGAASEIIAEFEPDIVVLDINLPDGSGLDLCKQLAETMPTTHCIVHTGTLQAGEAARATEIGAAAVVLKSLSGSDLLDAIRRVSPHPDPTPSASG